MGSGLFGFRHSHRVFKRAPSPKPRSERPHYFLECSNVQRSKKTRTDFLWADLIGLTSFAIDGIKFGRSADGSGCR